MLRRGDTFTMFGDRSAKAWVCLYANECRALVRPVEPVEVTVGERTFFRPAAAVSIAPGAAVHPTGRLRGLGPDTIKLPKPAKRGR